MSSLAVKAERRLALLREGRLPPWWQFGTFVAATAGAIVLGFSSFGDRDIPSDLPGGLGPAEVLFAGPGATSRPPSAPTFEEGGSDALPGSPEAGQGAGEVSSPQPQPGQGEAPTVQVPLIAGGYVQVPSAAADLASSAAAALFSGELAGLPLVEGFSPPVLPRPFDAVTTADVFALSVSSSEMSFLVSVDPDGPGPETLRPTTVTVVELAGVWRVSGVGG